MANYLTLMQRILEVGRRFGDLPQPPCSPQQIERLKKDSLRQLNAPVPQDYLDWLLVSNGLNWNGLFIFASERSLISGYTDRYIEGFVQENLDNRESGLFDDYLVFADDATVLYTYQISTGRYRVITTVGLTMLETFDNFDDLICDALRSHL